MHDEECLMKQNSCLCLTCKHDKLLDGDCNDTLCCMKHGVFFETCQMTVCKDYKKEDI